MQIVEPSSSSSSSSSATATYQWPHVSIQDDRVPLVVFRVSNQDYGFFFFDQVSWIAMASMLAVECCFMALFGAILYHTIVEPAKKEKKQGVAALSTRSVLLVCGVFLPFWIVLPSMYMDYLHMNHAIFRFCLGGLVSVLSLFRTVQALFGFTPTYAAESMGAFALWFAMPLLLRRDPKCGGYVRATSYHMIRHAVLFLSMLFVTGFYQSCFFLFPDYFPTLGSNVRPDDWYALSRIYDVVQWKNTLLSAFLLLFYLTTFSEGVAVVINLLAGFETDPLNNNPLVGCTSPSDFWGRRWNRLIHAVLKDGVYKPVRSLGGSSAVAATATFVASGVFHEWFLSLIMITDYPNRYGPTTLFFVWQAMLVVGEAVIGHWSVFALLGRYLPGPLRSLLIVLLGIPLGHFFLDSYVHSDFHVQGNRFLPVILRLEEGRW